MGSQVEGLTWNFGVFGAQLSALWSSAKVRNNHSQTCPQEQAFRLQQGLVTSSAEQVNVSLGDMGAHVGMRGAQGRCVGVQGGVGRGRERGILRCLQLD